MSFDYTTLITDRTQADVARVKALVAKGWAGMTEEEQAEWMTDLKGAYNASDMNRVGACLEDLVQRFHTLGYRVPNYARVKIQRSTTPASRLPEGYTEVEYIESSGTQYVNTGFAPNQNTRVVADYEVVAYGNSTAFIYGSRIAAGNTGFYFCVYRGNASWIGYANEVQQPTIAASSERHQADQNKNVFILDGTTVATLSAATFSSSLPIYLFALNQNGSRDSQVGNVRVYSCQIYDNGTLIRDFIPCSNEDGEAGLYDLVTEAFYANAGTGTFTAGDAVEWEETEDETDDLDPYTWYDIDAPTESEAAQYMANVAAVRSVLAVMSTTPTVPESMARLSVGKANDIEQILLDIFTQLNILKTTRIPCGEAICGGDNL